MKIALDFDDVLVDFVGAWLNSANTELGLEVSREDIRLEGWDMAKHASKLVGMDWLEWIRLHLDYWMAAETTPRAVEAIAILADDGHEVQIVTSKPGWARPIVWNWLAKNNPKVYKVVITNHFSKHDASDADVLVDDRPSTVRAWVDSSPDRYGILFARSQNVSDRKGLMVAETFDDVVHIVDTLSKIRRTDNGRARTLYPAGHTLGK